jgi:hypothetical protein
MRKRDLELLRDLQSMLVCRVCGEPNNIIPADGRGGLCPTCCDGHTFIDSKVDPLRFCTRCGHEEPVALN